MRWRATTRSAGFSLLTGAYSSNIGFFFVALKPWHDRHSAEEQAHRCHCRAQSCVRHQIPEAAVVAFGPPAIPGLGTGAGFTMQLQDRVGRDRRLPRCADRSDSCRRPVSGRRSGASRRSIAPRCRRLRRHRSLESPQVRRAAAGRQHHARRTARQHLRERLQPVRPRLQGVCPGGARVSAAIPSSSASSSCAGTSRRWCRSTRWSERPRSGPEFTNRFNLYRTAEVTGVPAPGYSSAQALDALEEVARQTLPPEMGFDWADMSYQEKRAPNPISSSRSRSSWCSSCWRPNTRAGGCRSACCWERRSPRSAPTSDCGWRASSPRAT